MFIAALFTVAKVGKQCKCPAINEWIKQMKYIHIMNTTTSRRNLAFVLGKVIMLSEISQIQKDKCYIIQPI